MTSKPCFRTWSVLILTALGCVIVASVNADSQESPKSPDLIVKDPTSDPVTHNAESGKHQQASPQRVSTLQHYTVTATQQQRPSQPQHEGDAPTDEQFFGWGIVKWTAIIAIASMTLAVTYVLIYNVMKHAMYLTDRPYLVVENLRIDEWHNGRMSISFRIGNYGKSPGWLTKFHIRAQVESTTNRDLRESRTRRPDYGQIGEEFGGVITPQQDNKFEVSDDPGDPAHLQYLTLQPHQKDDVVAGRQYLFIHGFIEYRDIHRRWVFFPNIHRACFGYRWIRDAKPNDRQFAIIGNDAYWHYT